MTSSRRPALLDNATNLLGPLGPDVKARLQAFFDKPCEETWDDIHGILVRPMRTVWQAVIAEDPTFPKTGPVEFAARDSEGRHQSAWERIPDAMLVARAIKKAIAQTDRR